jgi:hypothetical protein
LAGIVQYYHYDAERLPCCICNRAIHYAGAVVQLNDQSFRLVGSCCGRKEFGPSWALSKNAFEKAERSSLNQKRARSILDQRLVLERQLYELREPFSSLEFARRELKRGFGDRFHMVAVQLFRNTGRLSYVEKIGRAVADQGGKGSVRSLERETRAIFGWELFGLTDKRQELERAIGAMKNALNQLRDALDKSRVSFKHIRAFQDCRDRLVGLVDVYNASSAYRHALNVETFNNWFDLTDVPLQIAASETAWVFRAPDTLRQAVLQEWSPISQPSLLTFQFET